MEESRLSSRQDKLNNLSHILTIGGNDKQGRGLAERSKKQIEDRLSLEAMVLLEKQQKNQQKQDKLKELEDKFQIQRAKKQRQIESKLESSEKNKNKNLQNIQKKLNQVAKRHQSVCSRTQNQKQSELQKQFDSRKVYENEDGSRMSQGSQMSATSKSRKPRINNNKSLQNQESIDKKIFQINSRLEKAHSVTRQRQAIILNKIREHNTQQIQAAQQKAAYSMEKQINQFSHKIASKLQGADANKQKYDKSVEKRQEDKHKVFSEKIRNYHNNIKHLQDEEESKLQELSKKFDKNLSVSKFWKDEKGQIYHKKFLANYTLLEQKKISRADQIIQKHLQITNKNKVYKQRKETLFQAIKCDPNSS